LLASDLPEPLALARRRLAVIADCRKAGKRVGFGLRADGDGSAS
jgi:hypothetical protein